MGKGGKTIADTPKRDRSEDEISPSLVKDPKLIKMAVSEQEMRNLIAEVASITKKLDRLEMLDAIKSSQDRLQSSQDQLQSSFCSMEKRMDTLEKKYEELRETQENGEVHEHLRAIEKKNHVLEQALLNDRIIVKNLPVELTSDSEKLKSVVSNIFTALNIDIQATQIETFATKSGDKNSSNIIMKFASAMLKTRVLKQFRVVKKGIADECPLLVEKIVSLPEDHHLNGKLIMMSNKLTPHNAKLIQQARKFVSSHFDFAYDTPDGLIMVRIGEKFHKIEDEEDIQHLVSDLEKSRGKKKPPSRNRGTPSMTTRQNSKNLGG